MNYVAVPRFSPMHSSPLDASRAALSDAREWLVSDWTPVGAALTSEAGEARRALLAIIGNANNLIDAMKQDACQGIASLESQR